jgi:phage terminase large subunit-like protein
MPTGLALLGKIRSLQRLQAWALEQQAEQAPPETPPAPTADARSTEERFWDFFARSNPHLLLPKHFRVYVAQVLAAVGGDLRLVFAAPPQHGKTEVTLALLVFLALEHPGRRWAYVTYNQKRANSVARKVRRLFSTAGEVVGGTLAQMYLPGGGQILFTSVDGGITGEPIDGACFIDDPYKNRKEADSQARRGVVEETYREAIEVRVHPGASIFLLATRWHPQDLSGTLVEEGWQYINLRAIAEAANDNDIDEAGRVRSDPNGRRVGEALFPDKWSEAALEKKRFKVLEFTWAALYQGRPRPKGGTVFHDPTYYTAAERPTSFRGAYGIDLALTAKTSADWSICVDLREPPRKKGEPRVFYVERVDRKQVEAPAFGLVLKARQQAHRSWRMFWRASGTEKGVAQFLLKLGLPIVISHPPGDKLVSATEVAAAWNAGNVRVPDPSQYERGTRELEELEEWLYPFLDVVANFTGSGKEKDDDVDAIGNAHAGLMLKTGTDDEDGRMMVVERDDD